MYLFGITYRKPSIEERTTRQTVAKAWGCTYHEANRRRGSAPGINGGNYQGWFSGPNRGEPFDTQLCLDVMADLQEARRP